MLIRRFGIARVHVLKARRQVVSAEGRELQEVLVRFQTYMQGTLLDCVTISKTRRAISLKQFEEQ